jgi:hypothetical protein
MNAGVSAVRVELPQHLRTLAGVGREITLEIEGVVSVKAVLDAVEARYPMLKGTIREQGTQKRRAFLRFFACEEDWSHEPMDAALPESIAQGNEPLLVIGAIAGGTGRPAIRASRQRDVGVRGRFACDDSDGAARLIG